LVGWWKFDEGSGTNATDSSGSGNTGMLINGPTWVAGKIGTSALSFDGVNDYVNLGDSSAVNFGSGDFAFLAWVYNNSQNTRNTIFGKDSTTGRQFFIILNSDNIGTVTVGGMTAGIFSSTTVAAGRDLAAGSISTNAWHHIVFERVSGVLSIWVDGSVRASTSWNYAGGLENLTLQDTSSIFQIGGRSYTSYEDYFSGLIDDARIYNRALTTNEITTIYNYR
jgi:hypothetical protein